MKKSTLICVLILMTSATIGWSQIDCWHMDEGTGTTTADSCGAYPGTLVNSPQWVPSLKGSAIRLNGTDQYIRLNNGPILNQDAAFTIEAWVNWSGSTNSAGQAVIYCEADSYDNINLNLLNGTPSFGIFTSPTWYGVIATGPISSNTWHFVTGVLEPGVGGVLYVDGLPVATNSVMAATTGNSTETDIGRFSAQGRFFNGAVDEVVLYDSARTAAEIWADYQNYYSTRIQMYPGIAISGPMGAQYWIESSTNLADTNAWTILTSMTLTNDSVLFIDTNSPAYPARFYRAVPAP